MAIGAGAAGAWAANNATTQTITLPAHAIGDLLVVIAACKAATPTSLNIQITTPASGWTRVASFADGTLASGNGTGSVTQAIFYKVATSASETNPVVTWGGSQTAAPGIAVGLGFTKAASDTWATPVVVQAATNSATSISVTMGSNPGITAGDWGVIAHTTRDDSALTVPTWTATSATLGTAVVYPTTPIADITSNDMAGTAAYRSVTSGTASAAPVVTATQAAAETGVTGFIGLRVSPPATVLYFRATAPDYGSGNNDTNLAGAAISAWTHQSLGTTAGAVTSGPSTSTVAGPTAGLEVAPGGSYRVWYSPPLDAAVTIAGAISWNLWAAENNVAANVAINGILEVVDGATGAFTEIDRTARTTAVALTTRTVNNFAETPSVGIACKRGDRLRARVFADDAGTMASGFSWTFGYDGPTAGADGDSWLGLTEAITFAAEPAGTQVFPTDTASAVSTASVDREAWTSRGAGVATDVTNTVAGWTAPIQMTDTAGGTVVDWFTRPLTAFTLGGAVRVNARVSVTNPAQANRCEVAIVAGDGSGATVWAAATCVTGPSASEAALSYLIAGADVAITDGQRLRIRFYIDDRTAAMAASNTQTLYYAGAAAATGDTYLTFTQTLTESVSAPTYVPRHGFVNFQNPGVL